MPKGIPLILPCLLSDHETVAGRLTCAWGDSCLGLAFAQGTNQRIEAVGQGGRAALLAGSCKGTQQDWQGCWQHRAVGHLRIAGTMSMHAYYNWSDESCDTAKMTLFFWQAGSHKRALNKAERAAGRIGLLGSAHRVLNCLYLNKIKACCKSGKKV